MFLDNSVTNPQAEACAEVSLRGKERLKEPL